MNSSKSDTNPSKASTAPKASIALIITYYWPPSGGAGVQRWLKFSKYLPEFGWEPVILTVDPEYAAYPVTDISLNKDIPPNIKVFNTRATDYFSIYKKDKTKIPAAGFANSMDNTLKGKLLRFVRGNFFIPDPRKGWNKFAFKRACELIESNDIKHIVTTSPPHSTQLIGLKLKKKYPAIQWIADLRDPWTEIYYYRQFYPTLLSKWIDEGYEKRVLKNADRIITVGESLRTSFTLKEKSAGQKTKVITNGYDEEDLKTIKTANPSGLVITYTGTLSDNYPVSSILSALSKLQQKRTDFKLRFVGTVSPETKKLILLSAGETQVEFIPYVTHTEAISYMNSSTVLLLIIPDHLSNKSIITGKLFEYIASGKPLLCIGPKDGDAAGIIEKCRAGVTADYNDSEIIYKFLSEIDTYKYLPDISAVQEYSRRNLAKMLAKVLNSEADE